MAASCGSLLFAHFSKQGGEDDGEYMSEVLHLLLKSIETLSKSVHDSYVHLSSSQVVSYIYYLSTM